MGDIHLPPHLVLTDVQVSQNRICAPRLGDLPGCENHTHLDSGRSITLTVTSNTDPAALVDLIGARFVPEGPQYVREAKPCAECARRES